MNELATQDSGLVGLHEELAALRDEAKYYRDIFANTSSALLAEDLSSVKVFIDGLKARGVSDIRAHFHAHLDDLVACLHTFDDKFTANPAYLRHLKAENQEQLGGQEFYECLDAVPDTRAAFIALFAALAEGKTRFSMPVADLGYDGTPVASYATWTLATGYEETWGLVIVNTIPLQDVGGLLLDRRKLEDGA